MFTELLIHLPIPNTFLTLDIIIIMIVFLRLNIYLIHF